jgi:hypothetical protein
METGENLGGVGVKKYFNEGGLGTEIKIGQVDRPEMGILGNDGIEETVD